MEDKKIEFMALRSVCRALSDSNRLRVAAVLFHHRELCACHISDMLGIRAATTSRHMDVLLASGLVKSRKEGRWIHYRLNPEHFAIEPMAQWFKQLEKDDTVQHDLKSLDQRVQCKTNSCQTAKEVSP